VRVCRRFEVVDVHRTSRLDNFTSADQVFPGIARDWHQACDGMAAVSDLDRFPGGHFFEVPAGVLPQLPHPYRLHVLHSSTCDGNRPPRPRSTSTPDNPTNNAMPGTAPIVRMSLGRGQSSGAESAAQTREGHRSISSSGETPALLQLTHRDDLPVRLTNRCISYEAIPTDTALRAAKALAQTRRMRMAEGVISRNRVVDYSMQRGPADRYFVASSRVQEWRANG
jgi:hypothetical protein